MLQFYDWRFVNGRESVGWLRRVLIELWAMIALSAVVGFLGPFGTYSDGEFPSRSWHWWMQLMGAYVLVRPSILLWEAIAEVTALPARALVFWGVFLSAFPLALLWAWSADALFHGLNGFAGIWPFAMLCALGVLGVTVWARRADEHLRNDVSPGKRPGSARPQPVAEQAFRDLEPPSDQIENPKADDAKAQEPRLARRLPVDFQGPILALQSEDHYVRVHGKAESELLFMRLRDAIDEMDHVSGEQVHRSWWVAEEGIASVEFKGAKRTVRLLNGVLAPVARDSVSRLERSGFLRSARRSTQE